MDLGSKRALVARMYGIGIDRVWIDPDRNDEVKEAITKADLRALIKNLAIQIKPKRGISRSRARINLLQKKKGRRQGKGSREGSNTARLPSKTKWVNAVRLQRSFVEGLKSKKMLDSKSAKLLRDKIKGGYFRSKRHIKLFIEERKLIKHGKK